MGHEISKLLLGAMPPLGREASVSPWKRHEAGNSASPLHRHLEELPLCEELQGCKHGHSLAGADIDLVP